MLNSKKQELPSVAINSMQFSKLPINSLATPKLKASKSQDLSDYQTNILEFAAGDLHAVKVLKLGIIGK